MAVVKFLQGVWFVRQPPRPTGDVGLSRSKESARPWPAAAAESPSPMDEREAETRIGPQVSRAGGLVNRTAAAIYLCAVLGGLSARGSRLGDGVSD